MSLFWLKPTVSIIWQGDVEREMAFDSGGGR
jgi:hypothetical protein